MRAEVEKDRQGVRELQAQLLAAFGVADEDNQVPIILTSYPGVIVDDEGDDVFDPMAARAGVVPTPSAQRGYVQALLNQAHVAGYLR